MPKHMRWPKSCAECGCADGCEGANTTYLDGNTISTGRREYGVDLHCPLVVRDENGIADWPSNGWPEPTPFYGSVDIWDIPQPFRNDWLNLSHVCRQQFKATRRCGGWTY